MTDLRLNGAVSSVPRLTADNQWLAAHGLRDGAIVGAPWLTALALEGRVFGVNIGTGTSPTTFNATYAAAEPDLWVHVPSGTTIIPVYLEVCFEDTGTAQVMDVVAVASATGDSAVTGTALTIRNMRMDAPISSGCTATAVVTAAGTSPLSGNHVEFWRPYAGFGEDAFNGSTGWVNAAIHGARWTVNESQVPPIITGAGSLAVYASGQAATGFITAVWAELPSTSIV